MNYTIVAGTNRIGSNSLIIAKYYKSKFLEKGINCNLINLQDLPEKLIFSDMYGKRTEEFQKIQDAVTSSDKFIFIIPEYNGSFPGILKTFIDACTFPESYAGKKCVLVGLSSGKFGNLRGVEHFVGVANYIKMNVCCNKMYLSSIEKELNEAKEIHNEKLVLMIEEQIEEFINF